MTQDEIIRMARYTGKTKWFGTHPDGTNDFLGVEFTPEQLERFAALVAAHEREKCAKVCDKISWLHIDEQISGLEGCSRVDAADDCAAAIRARGDK